MNLYRLIFIIVGFIVCLSISWFSGFGYANKHQILGDECDNIKASIFEINKIQKIVISLDNVKLDTIRKLSIDYQDKEIFHIFSSPLDVNGLLNSMKKGCRDTLVSAINAIYNYRKNKNDTYYPKGKCLLESNEIIDSIMCQVAKQIN